MSMIKHSQSTQSNKLAIALQYLKKEVLKESCNVNLIKKRKFDTCNKIF